MAADQRSYLSNEEIQAEVERLEAILRCWDVGVTERQTAERSLRITRALQALLASSPATRLMAETGSLLADLQHLVRWHDQLRPADIKRAEATIARFTHATACSHPTEKDTVGARVTLASSTAGEANG